VIGYSNTEDRWNTITEVDLGGPNGVASKALALRATHPPFGAEIPDALTLEPNYPNPARQSTTIQYGIPQRAHVTLEVFDLLGRHVARPVDRSQPAGMHTVRIPLDQWSSGTYLYRLQAAGETQVGRMTVVR
jgi:hypothetical protein